jgi:hypothetical protein
MEEHRKRRSPDDRRAAAPQRQLPEPTDGGIDRLVEHTKGLTEDVSALVELHLKKAQLEVEERIDRKVNAIVDNVLGLTLVVLAVLFLLTAISFGIGALLGHPGWGFLIMALLLGIGGLVVIKQRPHLIQIGDRHVEVNEDILTPEP